MRKPPAHVLTHKIGRLRALGRYFRDRDASFFGKAFVLFAVAYVICPLDAIPDVAPIVGWLDDIGVMSLAMLHLSRVLDRYREMPLQASVAGRGNGNVIDVQAYPS